MGQAPLTHSDRYIKKTNRVILIVGIISLFVFLFGLMLLGAGEEEEENHYEIEKNITAETENLTIGGDESAETDIVWNDSGEDERPLTTSPNPVNMGQIVLNNESSNVLTIGSTGKKAIRIVSVDLEDAAPEGFEFKTDCENKILSGQETCTVTTSWIPTVVANVQNNFKIIWRESNLSDKDNKHDEVPIFGNAITKEDCNFCEGAGGGAKDIEVDGKNSRYAVGPDGKKIGIIGEDGLIYDENGNVIGSINSNGMIVDKDGNIIGVGSTGKLIFDENGNVIGYVDENGIAHDKDGNVIGRMLADGTVVDENGKVIGKAVDYGYVYDENGNVIGRVLADGTVVDLNNQVIGRLDKDGNVIGLDGSIIGRVAKAGEVALDENGKALGIVMPDNSIVDAEGNVVGKLDKDGNVITKQNIGKRGSTAKLAVDKDGNVIGYIDENGNVIDFNGNVIGKVNENGEIVDKDGNIIGRASDEWRDLVLDENGNVIGYVDKDGIVYGQDGKIIGFADKDGNIIGNQVSRDLASRRVAVDENGNVIGYIDENGNVIDFNGNVIGKVDENGRIVDKDGNVIGWEGKIDENGNVRDKDGNIVGRVDKNGNIIDKNGNVVGKIPMVSTNEDAPIIGAVDQGVHLALDENGNVIGYIDEDGNVRDFNGNIIGKVDENGNIIDKNGKIIGHRGGRAKLARDANGNIIGYVDDKGIVRNQNNEVIGLVDANGKIRAFGIKVIGSTLNRNMIPITPKGKVLGEVNNRGEVIKQQKVVGKMRPNGVVTDVAGNKILAKGVIPGTIINWGCDYKYRLDKDGVVRQNDEDTDFRVFADGTIWSPEGAFIGKVVETGKVYDSQCRYLGEAAGDGYVRDIKNREIGCLNPDGTVLDLKEPKIKGHLVKPSTIVSNRDFRSLGSLDTNGVLYNKQGAAVACMNDYGDMYNTDNVYIGSAVQLKYAFGFNGKLIGMFDIYGNLKISGAADAHVIFDNLIVDGNQRVIGYALPEIAILYDSEQNKVGHLFPDGNIYDADGAVVDVFNGGEAGIYNDKAARFVFPKVVVDNDGVNIGRLNYDLSVIADKGGTPLGKADLKGHVFDEAGHLIAGVVRQGSVRDYAGVYLGSVTSTGEVVQTEKVDGADGKQYSLGELTGKVIADGHVIKDKNIVGEVLPYDLMLDVYGNIVGMSNDHGQIISPNGTAISDILPGGGNSGNYVAGKQGIVVDFAGNIIGVALANGHFINTKHVNSGRILSDGKVLNNEGKIIGEVVSGDIVIGNDDQVKGLVRFDGSIYRNGNLVGKVLADGLAADNQNNVIGHVYTIGNAILSNKGDYIGRLGANGRVIGNNNNEIGYLKSNGSFVDVDKNVSGYSLPEAGQNRRN